MTSHTSIYHLVPASYYRAQPTGQAYRPATFAEEGFIHCTAGLPLLVKIANLYFASLPEELLILEIDPARLDAPLKFEAPISPTTSEDSPIHDPDLLFPHIYGPLNREAIVKLFSLVRDETGRWDLPG
jgi:uncharacterized protein (DUF952 family)